ncbi:MAG: hypothetical protein MJ078_07270, partial [Clostridia bacterium]|nr:hypothetical protein [Clostridia bacterium]
MENRKEVLFADLARQMEPADALCEKNTKDKWRTVTYSTADIRGSMVHAHQECRVPVLTLQPHLTGWYQIFVGLYKSNTSIFGIVPRVTALKTSRDENYVELAPNEEVGPWA